MDDFNITSITESKNEWCARFTNILTPCIIEGIKSIFMEADKICSETDEDEKYLMTFQNLLNNIPKWSSGIVETEKNRIINSSGCSYLEDLLSCIHITQLKALTISRVGIKQKKIDIPIPNLDSFMHKTYINVARKIYVNVYLFEKDLLPLQIQKNNRELEIIIKEAILNTVRDNIPIDNLLRMYLDETQETEVEVEETREVIPDEEEINKRKEKQEVEKLETIKMEVKEELKKEQENNLNNALKNANSNLNKLQDDGESLIKEKDLYTKDNYDNEKIVIDNKEINDTKLNIENLSKDIDEINLDNLDIDTETNSIRDNSDDEDINIDSDIEELS